MENNNEKQGFSYNYSAKEQEELRRIREKYIPKEENKMEQLRHLDQEVTRKGTSYSILIGIIGSLLLGLGMSCTLVWQGIWFIPGIIIGVIGMAIVAVAYPVYNIVTKREREKIAPEIIRLTEELIK